MDGLPLDFEHAGLKCFVRQYQAHVCGYVAVPKEHPLYGASYSEPHPSLNGRAPWDALDCHGGISWSGPGIATITTPDWLFGFGTNRIDDGPDTQDVWYVTAKCKALAEQLAAVSV